MIKKGGMQLRNVPDIPVLHQLLSKAVQKGGEKQYATWRNPDNLLLTLEVVSTLKERKLIWSLSVEKSGRKIELCQCAGHDILMVYNQVNAAALNATAAATRPDDNTRLNRTKEARSAALEKLQPGGSEPNVVAPQSRPGGAARQPEEMRPQPEVRPVPAANPPREAPPPQPARPAAAAPQSARPPQPEPEPPRSYFKEVERQRSQPEIAPVKPKAPEFKNVSAPSAGRPAPSGPAGQPPQTPPAPQPSEPYQQALQPKPNAPQAAPAPQAPHAPQDSTGGFGIPVIGNPVPAPVQVQPPAAPVQPAPSRPAEAQDVPESGSLKQISLVKLLRLYKAAKVSGRLRLDTQDAAAVIYLHEGETLQALMGELKGDEALTEILLMSDGQFVLSRGISTANAARNIETPPEVLLANHKQMAYLLKELQDYGMQASSTFVRSDASLTKDEFLRIASQEAPMDPEIMSKLYIKLDGKQTLAELAKTSGLSRLRLIEALYHMVSFELVDIYMPPAAPRQLVVTPKKIDGAMIQSVMMSLRREDTGLFIYPAFLYFLEEEFFRVYRARGTMTVIVFEMRDEVNTDGGVKRRVLPSVAIADAAGRIAGRKRHTDVVAHYEAYDYAVVLPGTGSAGTKVFVKKIIKALTETPLAGMDGRKLVIAFGTATIPEDFTNLNSMLGAAELALEQARNQGKVLVQYRDLLS
ncbi:MAG: DUF4388 domain-containing protein [Candidatus Melainabacteria bacterium]|nr:DUF4388 domain-containing protein [Candidatus Melainabacteria bacterium]